MWEVAWRAQQLQCGSFSFPVNPASGDSRKQPNTLRSRSSSHSNQYVTKDDTRIEGGYHCFSELMYVRVCSLEGFYEGQSSASKKEKMFHHDWWSHALILADTTARLERWPAHLLSRTSPVSARKPSLKIGFPGAKRWKSCWESSVGNRFKNHRFLLEQPWLLLNLTVEWSLAPTAGPAW